MVELASKIVVCIVLAAAIGFVSGFLLRGIRRVERAKQVAATWQARLAERDNELSALRSILAAQPAHPMPEAEPLAAAAQEQTKNAEARRAPTAHDSVESIRTEQPAINGSNGARLEEQLDNLRGQLSETQAMLEKLAQSQIRIESHVAMLAAKPTAAPQAPSVQTHPTHESETEHNEPRASDDLTEILGIGPALEQRLNDLGVLTFRQIARWTDADIKSFGTQLGYLGGRIQRDNWVQSAKEQHRVKYGDAL
jgi:predicted flap endonuclease-1-like 5' DNA nuclease